MEFRIADTFTDSLARLTGQEQKAVKTTAFDLQMNPANPGMKFHKIDRAKDPNFWSVRVSSDIRLIVHKTDSRLLLCYVDHHDAAYQWAACRKVETHPKTGAAQLVVIRETIKDIVVPRYVDEIKPEIEKPPLFADITDSALLSYGVPREWLNDVRQANEDTVLELAVYLPSEAAEALLDLATGAVPKIEKPVFDMEPVSGVDDHFSMNIEIDPFNHPDALRRFRVMNNIEELERALDYPWEKWAVFLHPAQRDLIEKEYNGPVRISGSAGTGKTVVALHRAVHLARIHPDARILLTTFSDTLANALQIKLRHLIGNEPRIAERLEIYSLDSIAKRLYKLKISQPDIIAQNEIKQLLVDVAEKLGHYKFSGHFLFTEWEQIVDAWQLDSWESYRDIIRLGRKTRLPESQRMILWEIFENVRQRLNEQNKTTISTLHSYLASKLNESNQPPFDYIVVDEAQDISVAQLRFLSALGSQHSDSLFFTGDLGQRIFQQPFSWKSLGIEIKGRSYTLRINYRTSHQIRKQADKLLAPELSDVDGNIENRKDTISVFNGPIPLIKIFDDESSEIDYISKWLSERIEEGILLHEMGVFVRSDSQIDRAKKAVNKMECSFIVLDNEVETSLNHISLCTMHMAKGLEFRAVVVMACDDEIIPLQERIETVSDNSDLEEVYNTERHLLYVACTRARDHLLVTGVKPGSEFLEDLNV